MFLPTSHNRPEARIHVPYVPPLLHVSVYRTYVSTAMSNSIQRGYLCKPRRYGSEEILEVRPQTCHSFDPLDEFEITSRVFEEDYYFSLVFLAPDD